MTQNEGRSNEHMFKALNFRNKLLQKNMSKICMSPKDKV